MIYILMAVFAILIVAADQISKFWIVHNVAPSYIGETFPVYFQKLCDSYNIDPSIYDNLEKEITVIPNFLQFSHIFNDGGAWGMFDGAIWLFVIIFILFAGFILWEFPKKRMAFTTFERFCIVAIFAGGLGNIIDRIRLGFVIDMIDMLTPIGLIRNFPIFNVADCFITCGCILLIVHLVFFNRGFWKDEKKK